jgi:cell division protein FtsW (lipid II flippase)
MRIREYGRASAVRLLVLLVMLIMLAFILLSLRNEKFDIFAILMGLGVSALFILEYSILTRLFKNMDRYLLILANTLAGIGMIVQYRLSMDVALRQLAWLAIGILVLAGIMALMRTTRIWDRLVWVLMGVSVLLLGSSLVFGREIGGALNWLSVGGFSFQPSEFVKVLYVLVLASLFKNNRLSRLIAAGIFTVVCLVLLMLQKDLGAAVLFAGTGIFMLYAATSNLWATLGSTGALAGGAVASYFLFKHVRVRVAVWQNPWSSFESQGYQTAQALMAIASGGLFGLGLGLGIPKVIPAYHTDFIFAAICEEFGIIFGVIIVIMYLVFIVRGILVSYNATDRYFALTALGTTAMITLQSFIIIAGVTKMIPLTGITMPFISYGGSSMIASMAQVGILQAVALRNAAAQEIALRMRGYEL